jgi:hypothetical protein
VRNLLVFTVISLFAVACNPTHADQVDALGGETPGVRTGPTHRPGQPCLVCHDGAIGDPQQFSVAGTVFETAGSATPADRVSVLLTDVTGATHTSVTNAAGNFYITPNQWSPHYPMTTTVTPESGQPIAMQTLISRDGACAGCHVDPVGPGSAGRVALTLEDGGTPP